MSVYPDEMPAPDSTKELLNAHQAAMIRELDRHYANVAGAMNDIKTDISGLRVSHEQHTKDDNTRFGNIDSSLGVLRWAYGLGVAIISLLLVKLGWK